MLRRRSVWNVRIFVLRIIKTPAFQQFLQHFIWCLSFEKSKWFLLLLSYTASAAVALLMRLQYWVGLTSCHMGSLQYSIARTLLCRGCRVTSYWNRISISQNAKSGEMLTINLHVSRNIVAAVAAATAAAVNRCCFCYCAPLIFNLQRMWHKINENHIQMNCWSVEKVGKTVQNNTQSMQLMSFSTTSPLNWLIRWFVFLGYSYVASSFV